MMVDLGMCVSFNGNQLEVSAVLADAEAVDRLVKALQANKTLLPGKNIDELLAGITEENLHGETGARSEEVDVEKENNPNAIVVAFLSGLLCGCILMGVSVLVGFKL